MAKKLFTIISLLLLSSWLRADEGMWLLNLVKQLNMNKMQEMGLSLTADEIYTINKSSLKDAVVALDHGSCTGEIVSKNGLLLTNHHCGFDEIQTHSTVENDYIKDGFWAKNYSEELPNPGKTVSFLVRIEDVTDKVNTALSADLSPTARAALIKDKATEIQNEAIGDSHYEAMVEPMFGGNSFYLFVYETFKDVRLVGAPPSSIGKYGGDTDNWMWPRHTGDFSLFRVYSAPDGSPAEYSEDNVPLKRDYFLPISLDGYKKGDLTLVLGFPGSTQRYLSSWGIEQEMDITNNTRIKVRTAKLDLIKQDMESSDKLRIQYAAKYSRSSNYWKYSIGQNKGLKDLNVVENQKKLEAELVEWIGENAVRKEAYGSALPIIEKARKDGQQFNKVYNYWSEIFWRGTEIISFSSSARVLEMALVEEDLEKKDLQVEVLKAQAKEFFKDYNAPTDQKVLAALLKIYYNDVSKAFHPDVFELVEKKYKGDFEKYVAKMFDKSIFVNETKYNDFLNDPNLKVLHKDPVFKLMQSVLVIYFAIMDTLQMNEQKLAKGHRIYIKALMEMKKDKVFYPDANSTMRLTYGTIGDYEPRDAVIYKHYTTFSGYIEKEDPGNPEFIVKDKMKKLYASKDFGRYGKDGKLNVCFTTNNDITGGNSGSPVINGKGELIGIAFDGNWESMSGDIAFEPELQKCICVDIRFVLFVIDKYAGATHLIDEMLIQ